MFARYAYCCCCALTRHAPNIMQQHFSGQRSALTGYTPSNPRRPARSFLGPAQQMIKRPNVAQPGAGTKRVCPETGKKFYDLDKDPIVSPYTGNEYPRSFLEEAAVARGATRKKDAKEDENSEQAETAKVDDEDEDDASPAIISLDDADDDDDDGSENIPDIDGDEDDEPSESADDNTFLETDDDENDDLSDVVKPTGDED